MKDVSLIINKSTGVLDNLMEEKTKTLYNSSFFIMEFGSLIGLAENKIPHEYSLNKFWHIVISRN